MASAASASAKVHPRACGGNLNLGEIVVTRDGPSPRVRGKQLAFALGDVCEGSIPARAGETVGLQRLLSQVEVHPRACGGNRESNL